MATRHLYAVVTLMVVISVLLGACGATPTPTPVPPTATPVPPTATKPPAPTATPAPPTATPIPPTPTPKPLSIKVGTDATFKPFEYVDEKTKQILGFDVDLMNAIAADQGIKVEEYVNINFDGIIPGLLAKKFDAIISAMTITEERKKQVAFSDPYINAGQILAVRQDNTTIKDEKTLPQGVKLGAQLGTTGEIEAKRLAAAVGGTVKSYDDITLAFQDLALGRLDAVVNDYPVSADYVASNPGAKLKLVGKPFTEEYYGIAVRPEDKELLARINAGLKKLKDSGKLDELMKKWGLK